MENKLKSNESLLEILDEDQIGMQLEE